MLLICTDPNRDNTYMAVLHLLSPPNWFSPSTTTLNCVHTNSKENGHVLKYTIVAISGCIKGVGFAVTSMIEVSSFSPPPLPCPQSATYIFSSAFVTWFSFLFRESRAPHQRYFLNMMLKPTQTHTHTHAQKNTNASSCIFESARCMTYIHKGSHSILIWEVTVDYFGP